jgi:hypothetical protein
MNDGYNIPNEVPLSHQIRQLMQSRWALVYKPSASAQPASKRRMRFLLALTIAVFTANGFSPAAQAQGKGRLAACKEAIQKLCASEPKGQGKVKACLKSNKDKVSADCKTALDANK